MAFGWDTERIDNPNEGGDFTLLAPGEYPFRILKLERGYFNGSAKMCPCPKAIITLEIDGAELGSATEKVNLFLNKKCEGILCQFFVAIGLRKHGDPTLVLKWNEIIGRTGRCRVENRVHEGKSYNEVKRFLDPPENGTAHSAPAPAAAAAPAPTQGGFPWEQGNGNGATSEDTF